MNDNVLVTVLNIACFRLGFEKKEPNVMGQFFLKVVLLFKTSVAYVKCIMDHFTQTKAGERENTKGR